MPASTRGKARDQRVFVKVNANLAFGWNSADLSQAAGVSNAELKTALGHMSEAEAMAASGVILVTGANSPKPARVTKRLRNSPVGTRATLSTYCAFDKLAAAAVEGFRLTKPGRPGPSLNPFNDQQRTGSGVVTLSNGLMVMQNIDPRVATAELRSQLGIETRTEIADTERFKIVFGARSKAGRVQIQLENGISAVLPFSTAMEDAAGTVGRVVSREFVEYPTSPD